LTWTRGTWISFCPVTSPPVPGRTGNIGAVRVEICGRDGGHGTCGWNGAEDLYGAFLAYVEEHALEDEVKVIKSGCQGACSCGPSVIVYPSGQHYTQVSASDVSRIVESNRRRVETEAV
jgi:NADP-reducing hydrogenase subunit HndC